MKTFWIIFTGIVLLVTWLTYKVWAIIHPNAPWWGWLLDN